MTDEKKSASGQLWIEVKASFTDILQNPFIDKASYLSTCEDAFTLMMFRKFRVIHDGLREIIWDHLQSKVSSPLHRQTHLSTPF